MRAAHAELTAGIRRPPELDLPRALVAATTTAATCTIARALRDAGYVVSTTLAGPDVCRNLRNQQGIELLVLDGSERPSNVGRIIDSVRAANRALPIVLISRPDPELRAEAERLGVEAILESPVSAAEIRRAATRIVPVVPEVELDLAG
jgi:CheY-like chemotaxis protein